MKPKKLFASTHFSVDENIIQITGYEVPHNNCDYHILIGTANNIYLLEIYRGEYSYSIKQIFNKQIP